MRVKKFDEYIKEGLWSKGVDRSKTGDIRGEQGKKVHTSIGVDIIIQDQSCDYEYFIKELLNNINESPFGLVITFVQNNVKTKKEMIPSYSYILNDEVIIKFNTYDHLIVSTEIDEDDISEHDYISIISGIAERLKQINLIERVYSKRNGIFIYDEYIPLLTKKQVEQIMKYRNDGEEKDYWEDSFLEGFQDNLMREFDADVNIYLEDGMTEMKLNYSSLSQYDKIMTYTKDYFYDELDGINEGLWSKGVSRSQTGEMRTEEGKKVKTKLGPEIIIQNVNCPYDKIIKQICDSSNWGQFPYKIYKSEHVGTNVLKMINDGEVQNWFNLPNIKGFVIQFPYYNDLKGLPDDVTEGDYYSMLKGIMESINSTKYLVNEFRLKFILITREDSNKIKQRLIDEDDQEYGDYIYDDFKDKLYDKFPPHVKQRTNIEMTKNMEIIIDFNYYTLLNYAKIVDWTKKFFKI